MLILSLVSSALANEDHVRKLKVAAAVIILMLSTLMLNCFLQGILLLECKILWPKQQKLQM